ncbi:MAG: S9 family peptidase [Verrucomicrobia bacterium]|nr:S9 family peptidase [Verrucomicrobiota bacterium]
MRLPSLRTFFAASLLLGFAGSARSFAADAPAPRTLTYADAAAFRDYLNPTLSRDGRWLAVLEMPQEGNGEVVVRAIESDRVWRVPAGCTPPPAFPRASSPNEKPPAAAHPAFSFTGDGRFLIVHAQTTAAEQAAARIDPAKPKPTRILRVLDLATGKVQEIARVKSYQLSARAGAVLACLVEAAPAEKKDAKATAEDSLLVHDLAGGLQQTLPHVADYTLSRDGRTLVFVVPAKDASPGTLGALDPTQKSVPVVLATGKTKLSKLTWDRTQTQIVYLSEESGTGDQPPHRNIQLWRRGEKTVRALVGPGTAGVPAGLIVSDKAALAFTPDGKKLLLGVAPPPPKKFTPPVDPEDRVSADLWSAGDDLIQPRQEVRAGLDRDRSYRAVVDLASGAYTQIGTAAMPDVLVSSDATRALAIDYRPYYRMRDYSGTYGDVYLLDLANGGSRRVLTQLRGGTGDEGEVSLQLSTDGHWATYYQEKQWHVLDLGTGETRTLTDRLPVAFYNELHDEPEPATAAGFGGWAADNQSVLLYDRYDLWQVFLDDRPAQNLTHGYGRAHRMVLRLQDFSVREDDDLPRGVNLTAPFIVRGEEETTRATGFLRFEGAGEPRKLLWRDCNYTYAGRAPAADRLMLTATRFDEFPDVWVTDSAFAPPRRITDGQAQLKPFKWGHGELISYKNSAGVPLQAALFLPPDFDPHKKYPLIVYTYERLSQIVHRFFGPTAGSNISFPIYASNGYIIMLADLAYTDGHPGACALDCINAALDAVEARGFVNEKAIGFQGSSWGGYTAAYLLTHSDRFAALSGGAIVSNMTSAYGGIRNYSGQARLFQYEQSQSRIGPPLSDAPELYLENSPLFAVKNARAPFLLLHNDRDGAVPFGQAVEFYLSLRRHNKPVWFFNYRDEGHGLQRLANRKDYSKRMWQFFDHFLRGAPAPAWLEKGIPYLDRDEEKVRFNAAP